MKYNLNVISTNLELQGLFPSAKIVDIKYNTLNKTNILLNSNGKLIDITHYKDDKLYLELQNNLNFLQINSLYINPIFNSLIICDRKLWYELYYPLLKYNKKNFSILEERYLERNITVLFNFAFFEALNYEEESEYFLYDFKFNNIKLTDYELFKDKKNFYYNSFYSLYHFLFEGQLNRNLNPNENYGNNEYLLEHFDIFKNFNITPKIERQFLYNHTFHKPRFHRIKFLLEANKKGILSIGRNNVNTKFIDEYNYLVNNGINKTDNGQKFSKNHLLYFNKELFDEFQNIKHNINILPENPDILYNHAKNYFFNKEYNYSYIEIAGETHCIFDLKYGFFTEKSLKPIISKNFLLAYGSNKVYDDFKKIGINLFLDFFECESIENKDELTQIEIIVNSLKRKKINDVKNYYIQNFSVIDDNQKVLFDYFIKIMNEINDKILNIYNL